MHRTPVALAENFYVVTQHNCTVLLNKDTFEPRYSCTPEELLFVLLNKLKSPTSSSTLRGLSRAWLLLASSAGPPDKSCSHFTVANVHINNECGKRRSVCIGLLLLIRDLCLKLGAVVLTGDFHKGAERELPVSFAFPCSKQPSARHVFPVPPWRLRRCGDPALSPMVIKWPACCGFVILPGSQNELLIMKHGSFNIKPAELGLKPNDQTWHHERWSHFKLARRKRRRDASRADSNSRRRS